MEIKFKIISVDAARNAVLVQYYTAALLLAYPPIRDKNLAMVAASFPEKSPAEVAAYVEENYPCGTRKSVDLPVPPPANAELLSYIAQQAPEAWLQRQNDLLLLAAPAVVPVGIEHTAVLGDLTVSTQIIAPLTVV